MGSGLFFTRFFYLGSLNVIHNLLLYVCQAEDVPIYLDDSVTLHLTDAAKRLALACEMSRCLVAIAVNFLCIPGILKCKAWLTKEKSQCKIKYKYT